jgi:prepilin-type N-terminal cleavage/methylation domain-containing protein
MGGVLMKIMDKKGFTLVEVLIAMFILSVGILAVVSMLTTSLRSGSFGRATTVSNRLIQQQMEEAKSMGFSTMVNSMCGLGVPQAAGFIGSCTITKYMVFNNRTATDAKVNYSVPSGGLSSVTYEVTMQSVKNHPMKDVDMVTGKAKWADIYGEHNTTAMTYMER